MSQEIYFSIHTSPWNGVTFVISVVRAVNWIVTHT